MINLFWQINVPWSTSIPFVIYGYPTSSPRDRGMDSAHCIYVRYDHKSYREPFMSYSPQMGGYLQKIKEGRGEDYV
jgi:hypothetical protein